MFRFFSVVLCALFLSSCAVNPDIWQPYPTLQEIKDAKEGWYEGNQMPNLVFKTVDGENRTLKDFRGKVVFVHFWGSWCPPCKKEMRHIQSLHDQVKSPEIEFVLLNQWESFADSQKWMKEKNYSIPIYDSLSGDFNDKTPLTLANGERIHAIKAVPKTFIIDKNGVIIYRRDKSKSNWPSYAEALHDVVQHTVFYE